MGRVKSIAVKSLGNDLYQQYRGRFSADFEVNKKVLGEVCHIDSKKVRNVMAGYLVTKTLLQNKTPKAPKKEEEE